MLRGQRNGREWRGADGVPTEADGKKSEQACERVRTMVAKVNDKFDPFNGR